MSAKEPTVKFPVTERFLSISDAGGVGSPHSDKGTALGRGFPGLLPQEKGEKDRAPEKQDISRVSPQFSELFLPSDHPKPNYTICLHGDEKKLECRDLQSDHSPH